MIYVRISGGIGNQLFQYAAARYLATLRSTDVVVDLHTYSTPGGKKGRRRSYQLGRLSLPEVAVCSPRTYHAMRARGAVGRALGLPKLARMSDDRRGESIEAFSAMPDGSLLIGYYQSEDYFKGIAERIRKEFTPRDQTMLETVHDVVGSRRRPGRDLVSLHVRRGDYLAGNDVVLPIERIKAAMATFPDSDFLIFSDDLPWCREAFRGDGIFFSPFKDLLEDLSGMAMCDHNIIANSTFSWWAAWLNPRPGKRVVAPRYWTGQVTPDPMQERRIYAAGWEIY